MNAVTPIDPLTPARLLDLVSRHVGDVVIVTDATGRAQWVNDAFVKLTGYSPDEIVGRVPGRLLQGRNTSPGTVADVAAAVRAGEPIRTQILNYSKSGREYWLDMDIRPVRADDGRLVQFIAIERDVTAQKAETDELQRRDMLFRDVCRLSRIGYWEQLPDRSRVKLSPELCEILGLPLGTTPSLSEFKNFYAEADQARLKEALNIAIREGRDAEVDAELINAKGERKWVRVGFHGSLSTEIFGTIQDITERHRQEKALEEEATRLRLATQAAFLGRFELDQATGALWIDERLGALYGLPAGRVEDGLPALYGKLVREDADTVTAAFDRIAADDHSHPFDCRIQDADGTLRTLRVHTDKLSESTILGTVVDMTEASNRIAAVERLTGALSERALRLELALAAGELGVWEYDCASRSITIDRRMAELFERDAGVVPGGMDALAERIHEEDRETARRIKTEKGSDRVARGRFRLVRKDGSVRYIEMTGRYVGAGADAAKIVGTVQDRTESVSALARVTELAETLKVATLAAGLGVWSWDKKTNHMFVDEPLKDLLGLTDAQAADMHESFLSLILPEDRDRFVDTARAAISQNRPYNTQLRLRPAGADITRIVEIHAAPRFDSGGEAIGYVGVNRDVTEMMSQLERERALHHEMSIAAAAAGIGVWRWDAASHVFSGDERLASILGHEPRPIADLSTKKQFIHPDDAPRNRAAFRAAVAEHAEFRDRYRVELEHTGRVIHVETLGRPYFDASGQFIGYIGVLRDVSEDVARMEALNEKSAQLSIAASAGGMGVWQWDLATRRIFGDGNIRKLFGVPAKEGADITELTQRRTHPSDLDTMLTSFRSAAARGATWRSRHRIIPEGGREFRWVEAVGEPEYDKHRNLIGYLGVIRDVDQEEQFKVELQSANRQLSLATDIAGVGVWHLDVVTGAVTGDRKLFDMAGLDWSEDGDFSHALDILLPPAERVRFVEDLKAAIRRKGRFECEHRILAGGDAGPRYAVTVAEPLPHRSGRVRRYVGITRDVTDDRKLQMELIAAKEGAEAANRAKSAFLATMSHELRTPLNAIIGFSELIEKQALGPEALGSYSDYAGMIHSSGQHLLAIVNDLIDVARIEAGQLTVSENRFCLEAALKQACTLVGDFDGRVQVKGLSRAHAIEVTGDKRLITQALTNIISNALRHGGESEVAVDFGLASQDGPLLIWVADHGTGMNESQIETAFRPFGRLEETERNAIGGAGLGLPIARSFAVAHGGTLILDSAPGFGTTAVITLPASRVEVTDPQAVSNSGEASVLIPILPEQLKGLGETLQAEVMDFEACCGTCDSPDECGTIGFWRRQSPDCATQIVVLDVHRDRYNQCNAFSIPLEPASS